MNRFWRACRAFWLVLTDERADVMVVERSFTVPTWAANTAASGVWAGLRLRPDAHYGPHHSTPEETF